MSHRAGASTCLWWRYLNLGKGKKIDSANFIYLNNQNRIVGSIISRLVVGSEIHETVVHL